MEGSNRRPASTGKCPFCGATLRSDQKFCPDCGAENPHYVEDTPRRITHPKTVAELKEYCAERSMPLLRMRFFVGEDCREARAFGIYQNGDRFVVYKNKDDGSRSVRYDGPDEAYAVNELFQKLLAECHNRGIYPDREPGAAQSRGKTGASAAGKKSLPKKLLIWLGVFLIWPIALLVAISSRRNGKKIGVGVGLLLVLGIGAAMIATILHLTLLIALPAEGISYLSDHKGDGYYRYADQSVYYKDGTDYYCGYPEDDWWVPASSLPAGGKEGFLG